MQDFRRSNVIEMERSEHEEVGIFRSVRPPLNFPERSGYGKDGIFRSLRPPLKFPEDENTNMVSFMFRNLESYSQRLALADADSGEKLSFREFKDKVSMVGSGLNQLGIRKGDVVLLLSPNSIYVPVCFFGIVSIGAVATTVNPWYTDMEVAKQVRDSKPKLIITVTELWDGIEGLNLYALGFPKTPIISFSEFLTIGAQKNPPDVIIKQTDTAALLFSSGTTGASKGVVLTHRNFIATALMVTSDQERKRERHTVLCVLPMFHVFGLAVITYAQLQRGNTVVSVGKFTMERMLKAIEEYKVTYFPVVPPIVIAIAKEKMVARYDLSSLKEVVSGAAPLGKDIMEECAKIIPHAAILQGYALTESCGIATLGIQKERNIHFGSGGILVPGIEAKVVSLKTRRPLPPNQRGELWFRGPNIMPGVMRLVNISCCKENKQTRKKGVGMDNKNVNGLESSNPVLNPGKETNIFPSIQQKIFNAGLSEDISCHSSRLLATDFQSQGFVQQGIYSVISHADSGLNQHSFSSGEVALYGPECSCFGAF